MGPSGFDLGGHTALVTGSTRGIGSAIADGLREAGARVLRHGLPHGQKFREPVLDGDLLRRESAEALIDQAFGLEPGLDLLISNAGSFYDRAFLEMTAELFDRTMALNVRAGFFLCQVFAKRLVSAERTGAIVLTVSINGFQAEMNSAAYDMSKGALVMMTRSLALSLAEHGIRVNGIAPGLINTPKTREVHTPEAVDHYTKKIPLRRLGEPADCAGAVVFLCSSAASYITGELITVDGGLSICQFGRMD
jgi:NAD(P)-dependent dehydrogenase (short-subunit alcohol dehydrogenase family)